MALQVFEVKGEKLNVDRGAPSYSLPMVVFPQSPTDPLPTKVDVYNRVMAYLRANNAIYYLGMVLDAVDIDEAGGGVWNVTVSYKPPEGPQITGPLANPDKQQSGSPPGGDEGVDNGFSITVSETTRHITQSLETKERRRSKADSGSLKGAPDFKRSIGVTKTGVEGVDIPVGAMELQITRTLKMLTTDYIRTVNSLVGCTNNAPFWGFAAGEVRFKGASFQPKQGGQSTGGAVEFTATYNFAMGVNRVDVVLITNTDDLTMKKVNAFDYLWVSYETAVSEGRTIERPVAAYVEKVREEGNFELLAIGA